jgi:hypothetical protein
MSKPNGIAFLISLGLTCLGLLLVDRSIRPRRDWLGYVGIGIAVAGPLTGFIILSASNAIR